MPVLPGARAPHDQQVRHINRLRRARGGQAPGRRRHVTRGCRLACITHPTQQGVQEFPSTPRLRSRSCTQRRTHAVVSRWRRARADRRLAVTAARRSSPQGPFRVAVCMKWDITGAGRLVGERARASPMVSCHRRQSLNPSHRERAGRGGQVFSSPQACSPAHDTNRRPVDLLCFISRI